MAEALATNNQYFNLKASSRSEVIERFASESRHTSTQTLLTTSDLLNFNPIGVIVLGDKVIFPQNKIHSSTSSNTNADFVIDNPTSYYTHWEKYIKGLSKNNSIPTQTIFAATNVVEGLRLLFGDVLKLPTAYPLNNGDFEMRWDSKQDSMIIQIDEDGEMTLLIRDKLENKSYGFDAINLEQFLSIELSDVANKRLTCLYK